MVSRLALLGVTEQHGVDLWRAKQPRKKQASHRAAGRILKKTSLPREVGGSTQIREASNIVGPPIWGRCRSEKQRCRQLSYLNRHLHKIQ